MSADIKIHNIVAVFVSQSTLPGLANCPITQVHKLFAVESDGQILNLTMFGFTGNPVKFQNVSDPYNYNAAEDKACDLSTALRNGDVGPLDVAIHNAQNHHDCSGSQHSECGSVKETTVDEGMI